MRFFAHDDRRHQQWPSRHNIVRLGSRLGGQKHISVPVSHIKSIEIKSGTDKPVPRTNWKTLRLGGTYWPGKITAGTYWSLETKEWSFWNIRKGERVVVIELEGEKYSRLVLEVGDLEAVVEKIQFARMEEVL